MSVSSSTSSGSLIFPFEQHYSSDKEEDNDEPLKSDCSSPEETAMDRNEGIVRWSPNTGRDEFITVNLNLRVIQVYGATGHAKAGQFDFEKLTRHNEWSHLNTYDWSPVNRGLFAVGTAQGDVHLLRIDDGSNAFITLPLKLQRACQTVAFNTTGLLAVGLDRVRNDNCLQIYDVNQRLVDWDTKKPGFSVPNVAFEPKKKLEASVSVTSVRFFEDQPQTLVAGIKNQSVRIHDLRDPNSTVINFTTRCNNNIAIDYTDSNYFASSSLDQPGFVVWDRRAANRPTTSLNGIVSQMYRESIEDDEIPWGGALKIEKAIHVEKNVAIKQLRFSRERRGALGVLSTAGQLQVYQTKKEYIEPGPENEIDGSPELLEVRKTYDLEYPHSFNREHKRRYEDRIVSFDWLNIGTTDLEARVIVLRANGSFEIIEMPSATAGHLGQLTPWKAPHRLGDSYMTLMKFSDPAEQELNLGPLYASAVKSQVPVFGPESFNNPETIAILNKAIKEAIHSNKDPVIDLTASNDPKDGKASSQGGSDLADDLAKVKLDSTTEGAKDTETKAYSSRELHDQSHYSARSHEPASKKDLEKLNNVMLQRAINGYLFDSVKNKAIAAADDDAWLEEAWDWVLGAEQAAADDGMVSGPLDLSYMGVYTLWNNSLGEKCQSRLINSTIIPDGSQWERLIADINKRAARQTYNGVETSRPQTRQLCLAVVGMVQTDEEFDDELESLMNAGRYTTAAGIALFEGSTESAIQILKEGGSDLIFVAMALEMKHKIKEPVDFNSAEWSKVLGKHPSMADDAYLRAIYSYITTGDWANIANQDSLPLRARVGVALRSFDDEKLSAFLEQQMEEAIIHGDIEGLSLAGITDNMVDIFAKYIEKHGDYQSPILILSFCYPRYINDLRCDIWRKEYKDYLQRHKKFIPRVFFEQQSTIKSRDRNGVPAIKPPPRQVTIRCRKCDSHAANDLENTAGGQISAGPSTLVQDTRNPLAASGINAGLHCPKCGSTLSRCAVCLEIVGVPRSDRPELSTDPDVRRLANFPSFCLKCKHVMHADHADAWFRRHVECAVPECRCQCNAPGTSGRDDFD